jgi:predicted GH43/DUF377 family glycosyl hydrolase
MWMLPLGQSENEIKLEAGAHPVQLSSGDWLHLYAAATPGWVAYGNYTVGWIVISDADPSKILARSMQALMVPTFDYETLCEGDAGCRYIGERKNVIFMCSADPIGKDTFRLFFGGGDGNVGTAVLTVKL